MLQIISEKCKNHGFSKRGHAFFRVHGDGVLQVLKYSVKKHPFFAEIIEVGLFSMYGELLPQWFTSSGCIPRYNGKYLEVPRWSLKTTQLLRRAALDGKEVTIEIGDLENISVFHLNPDALEGTLFLFLDRITTQESLIWGIEKLEQCSSPAMPEEGNTGVRWTDMLKYAPYLATGEYENAAKIPQALLELCLKKMSDSSPRIAEDIVRRRQEIELALCGDLQRINEYLHRNYNQNCKYASFCMNDPRRRQNLFPG